jgi:hypothetical protein
MSTTVEPVDYQELEAFIKSRNEEDLIEALKYIYEILRQLRAESDLDS